MTMRFASRLALLVVFLSTLAHAQTDPRMALDPWPTAQTWGQTHDDILYQAQAHLKGEAGADAQIFWWDSTGRFRLNTDNPDAPLIGYRYVTMNFDSNPRVVPVTFDEVSRATTLPVGEWAGGRVSVLVGAASSGDVPFADSGGVFGSGRLLWERRL